MAGLDAQSQTQNLRGLGQAGATDWFATVANDQGLDPDAAATKYGSLARAVVNYAKTGSKEAAVQGAQEVGAAACLAAGAYAPICAAVVVVLVPAIASAIDAIASGGPTAQAPALPATPPAASVPVSNVEMAQLINASEALRADEQRALGVLARNYQDGIKRFVGWPPDSDTALAYAKAALLKAGYNYALVEAGPSQIDQNEKAAFGALRGGQTWDQYWQTTCADPSNVLRCTPGNSIWSRVSYGPGDGRGSYTDAVKEVQARIYAFPGMFVKAASYIAEEVARQGILIETGRNSQAAALAAGAAKAGSEYLTKLQATDPEKYQAMQDAIAQGQDPAAVSAQIDASRSPLTRNTGSEPVMPAGAGGVGVAVLLIGGLGLLMLLARRGGR